MLNIILGIAGSIFCAFLFGLLVFLIVGSTYEVITRKRLVKDMVKLKEKYYLKKEFRITEDNRKYVLTYYLLKPEWYKKIKSEKYTTIGFDIDTAYVDFARVDLTDVKENLTVGYSVYCCKLRRELKDTALELLEQIKENNISDENYSILKYKLNEKLKEKELLKDY